jgi:tRNA pseudouridine55 synthase
LKRAAETNGVLVIDKPADMTSFDVVRRIRGAAKVKKVGHAGTLDPMATGVLLVCLGQATKLVPFLQGGHKTYSGRLVLGLTTDTDDITGTVTAKKTGIKVSRDEIHRFMREFVGTIEQVPPQYSAIKINGRPAYEMARRGERIPARARWIHVFDFGLTEIDWPELSFTTRVSKGTYIRSLAADLGRRLRTGACLTALRRVSSEPFRLSTAVSFDEAVDAARRGHLNDHLIPIDQALSFLPSVDVSEAAERMVLNGRSLSIGDLLNQPAGPGPVRIHSQDRDLLAVYEYNPLVLDKGDECLVPLRVLGRQ